MGRLEREIDEELEFHVFAATMERRRAGMSNTDARAAAEAAFGSRESTRRACVAIATSRRRQRTVLLALAACLAGMLWAGTRSDWSRVSPFARVVQTQRVVHVAMPSGDEFELLAIDGLPIQRILNGCEAEFGERCEKRFAEDLVEVLQANGHDPDRAVDLTLRDPATGAELLLHDQPMTPENRREVWEARHLASCS